MGCGLIGRTSSILVENIDYIDRELSRGYFYILTRLLVLELGSPNYLREKDSLNLHGYLGYVFDFLITNFISRVQVNI